MEEEVYVSGSLFDAKSEDPTQNGDEQEDEGDEIVPEKLAREMLDLTVETVTSGKYKRKLEAREICKQKIDELMTRVEKKMRTDADQMSVTSSISDFYDLKEKPQESDNVFDILSNPEKLEDIISGDLPTVREDVVEVERPSTKLDTRKQRVKYCMKLREEAMYLNVQNLILQRKINQINKTRQVIEKKPPREESLRDKMKRAGSLKKEYNESLLEYREAKEALVTQKDSCEADLAKRRKREIILAHALRMEEESLRALCVSTLTQLRSTSTRGKVSASEAEELFRPLKDKLAVLKHEHFLYSISIGELSTLKHRVKSLEIYGEGTNIDEYEQMEDRCHKLADLIQEREEQLKELNSKATNEIQVAAHLMDFIYGMEEETNEALEELEDVNEKLKKVRKEVIGMNKRRDTIRKITQRILMENGLMEYPDLLRDFKEVRERVKKAEEKLDVLIVRDIHQEASIERAWLLLVQFGDTYREEMPEVFPILESFRRRNTAMPSVKKSLLVIRKPQEQLQSIRGSI